MNNSIMKIFSAVTIGIVHVHNKHIQSALLVFSRDGQ